MMNLDQYLDELYRLDCMMCDAQSCDPKDSEAAFGLMAATLSEALREFPGSCELWCIKGDYLFIESNSDPALNEDVLAVFARREACYKRAIQLNCEYSYAYESLGHLYHLHSTKTSDYWSISEFNFNKAIELNAGVSCYIGLAQLFAATGRKSEAMKRLEEAKEEFGSSEDIDKAEREINDGYWDK